MSSSVHPFDAIPRERDHTESGIWRGEPFRSLAALFAVGLAIGALSRLELWLAFEKPLTLSISHVVRLLGLGALNDLLPLSAIALVLVGCLALTPDRFLRSRVHPIMLSALFFLFWFGLLFQAAAEHYFFEEFDARFNLVAVDYLIYPHEVLINIRDSYPVGAVVTAAAIISILLTVITVRMIRSGSSVQRGGHRRRSFAAVEILVVLGVSSVVIPSTISTGDRIERELTDNGIRSFFRSFATNEIEYPRYYRTEDAGLAYQLVREDLTRDGSRFLSAKDTDLTHASPPIAGLGPLNVVVVVEESFGCEFVGSCGGQKGLSPRFDALTKDGITFSDAYATGTRTVRGLEAITLSFPPIPSESVIKRPGNAGLANWGQVMRRNGYHASFLYGGFGTFDNMNSFFSSNGFEISDRLSIENPKFGNIWGVSDQDLFRHALGYFDHRDAEGRPFFSIIMTTSNHKPFTFPEGVPGVPPEGGGRESGIQYADYALGEFIEQASVHDWFDDTLFVIVADHGARVYGRAEVPLPSYHIPLLLYAPSTLAPRTVETPVSQMDIAPTVLGLLGLPWEAPFYGQNIFSHEGPPRILLNHNHDVALLSREEMVILGLHDSVDAVRVDLEAGEQIPIPADPDLVALTTAYYQTAYDQFHSGRYRWK